MSEGLPRGWAREQIGSICHLINGRAFKPTDWTETGLPIVRIQNLNNKEAPFNRFEGNVEPRYLIDSGELLFAWSGTPGTSFGAHIWDRGPAILNQHIFRVVFNESCLDKQFLRYAINDKLEHLIGVAHGGAGLAHVTKPVFEATPIVVPPLEEQKRIVAKVEDLIARIRRAKKALDGVTFLADQFRQSILAAAFRGDLTADWRAKNSTVEPSDKLLQRIEAERRALGGTRAAAASGPRVGSFSPEVAAIMQPHLDRLPLLGWGVAALEALCDPTRPITYGIVQSGESSPGGIPTVRCGDIKEFRIDQSGLKRVSPTIEAQYPRTRLKGGEVLVAIRGTVGGVAVAGPDLDGANISREVAMLAPLRGLVPEFLVFALASPLGVAFLSHHTKGVAQSGVNIADLRSFPVVVPPETEQIEVVARVQRAFAQVRKALEEVAKGYERLDQLERATLAKAFRGELVPQDSSDEPASVMLDRIRAARDKPELAGTGARRRSREAEAIVDVPHKDDDTAPQPAYRLDPARHAAKNLGEVDPEILQAAVFAALWTQGPLEKDDAVRRVAEHLRQAGHVDFQRLRADGALYGQILAALESAAKAGRLDRPKRGYVRACKADATVYRVDDWRHALLASLGTEPTDQDEAIRAAAEWARDHMGLAFTRLRSDGHIAEGLRSAINSAIRRGEVVRHSATRIARAPSSGHEATGQLSLTLDAPAGDAGRRGAARSHRDA